MEIRLSGKLAALVLLITLCAGGFGGGALVLGYEWGSYSELMARASEATKKAKDWSSST